MYTRTVESVLIYFKIAGALLTMSRPSLHLYRYTVSSYCEMRDFRRTICEFVVTNCDVFLFNKINMSLVYICTRVTLLLLVSFYCDKVIQGFLPLSPDNSAVLLQLLHFTLSRDVDYIVLR